MRQLTEVNKELMVRLGDQCSTEVALDIATVDQLLDNNYLSLSILFIY